MINKKYSILSLLFLLSVFGINAQNFKKISKDKMKKDFEAFINFQKEVNPQIEIKKEVTGYDIIKELETIKQSIDTITQNISYYKLIYTATTACMDLHNRPYDGFSLNLKFFLRFLKNKRQIEWFKWCKKQEISGNEFIYLKGHYFNQFPFYTDLVNSFMKTRKLSKDSVFFPIGIELKSYQNLSPEDFLHNSLNYGTRWDNKKKIFYTTSFKYFSNPKLSTQTTSYIDAYKNELNYQNSDSTIIFSRRNYYLKFDSAFVSYFEKDKILFIRIPEMNNWNFYPLEIAKFQNKEIQKIVIDIRGNNGGNDYTWMNTIVSIIADPLKIPIKTVARNTNLAKKLIGRKVNKLLDVPFLESDKYFICTNDTQILNPEKKSLNYKKNIYILIDENSFSSSLAFASIAKYFDNIITVGKPTGRIGGRGISPVYITLPYSKLMVQAEPLIDVTNCNTAEDVYHDDVEVLVEPDIKYYQVLFHAKNPYSEEFLYQYDPYFKKVLEAK